MLNLPVQNKVRPITSLLRDLNFRLSNLKNSNPYIFREELSRVTHSFFIPKADTSSCMGLNSHSF
jgi:hypothetical protein